MSNAGATDYAVRVWLEDGSTEPPSTEEMHWVSLNIAKRIASKAFEAPSRVVNSPVTAIEIINAEYETVIIHRFGGESEEEDV